MFLDNLSTSVLKLCDTQKLSYEAASERCDLSSRYFGDIARGKTAPTIMTLDAFLRNTPKYWKKAES